LVASDIAGSTTNMLFAVELILDILNDNKLVETNHKSNLVIIKNNKKYNEKDCNILRYAK